VKKPEFDENRKSIVVTKEDLSRLLPISFDSMREIMDQFEKDFPEVTSFQIEQDWYDVYLVAERTESKEEYTKRKKDYQKEMKVYLEQEIDTLLNRLDRVAGIQDEVILEISEKSRVKLEQLQEELSKLRGC
jgi:hypothetical protein